MADAYDHPAVWLAPPSRAAGWQQQLGVVAARAPHRITECGGDTCWRSCSPWLPQEDWDDFISPVAEPVIGLRGTRPSGIRYILLLTQEPAKVDRCPPR